VKWANQRVTQPVPLAVESSSSQVKLPSKKSLRSQAMVGAVNAAQKCRGLILPLKIWNPPPALLELLSNDDRTTKALELSPKVSRNLVLQLHHLSHNQERKAPLCYRPAASRSALMPGLRQIAPGNTQHHSVAFHLRLTHPR
jgi:hypothetical protein